MNELALPPSKITTRDTVSNKTLAEMKDVLNARCGQRNERPIQGHEPGTLFVKAATVDGSPERWRILYEWEKV